MVCVKRTNIFFPFRSIRWLPLYGLQGRRQGTNMGRQQLGLEANLGHSLTFVAVHDSHVWH